MGEDCSKSNHSQVKNVFRISLQIANCKLKIAKNVLVLCLGMIGFDREIDAYTCMAEVGTFLKNPKT